MKEYPANSLPLSMGNTRKPLRITVVRTTELKEIYGDKPPRGLRGQPETTCPCFKVGDSYMVTDKGGKPPADFPCAWAWHDLFQVVLGLQLGGNYPEFEDGVYYASCTNGLHPVYFRLERVE